MGGGINRKHSWRGIKLPLFGLIGFSQASQLSLSDQLILELEVRQSYEYIELYRKINIEEQTCEQTCLICNSNAIA